MNLEWANAVLLGRIQASRIDPPLAKCGRELLDMLQNPIAHLGDQSKRAKQYQQEQRDPFDRCHGRPRLREVPSHGSMVRDFVLPNHGTIDPFGLLLRF
jgi:hypothetical protein